MYNLFFPAIFILFLIFEISCIKDTFDKNKLITQINVDAGVALPIGYKTFTINNLINNISSNANISIGPDSFVTLKYHQKVSSYNASHYVQFPPDIFIEVIQNKLWSDIDLSTLTQPMVIIDTAYMDFSFNYGLSNELIDSIWFNKCSFDLISMSDYKINGNIQFTFPALTKNGLALQQNVVVGGTDQIVDLSGYHLKLNSKPNSHNLMQILYKLTINQTPVLIPSRGVFCLFQFELSNTVYDAMFGYIGKQPMNIPVNSVMLDFYNQVQQGFFHFQNPKMIFRTANSMGIPIGIGINNFQAKTKYSGLQILSVQGLPTDTSPAIIKFPSYSQIGQTVNDSAVFDITQTGLFTTPDKVPTQIFFGVNAMSNPNGNTSPNFILKDSHYDVDLEFQIPLWGYTKFLLMQTDTIKFNVKQFYNQNFNELKQLQFLIDITNRFPIDFNTQIYFADATYNIIDSMFTAPILIAGATDTNGDGKVEPLKNPQIKIDFLRARIDKVANTAFLLVNGRLNTTNSALATPPSYKFYSCYYLNTHIGVAAELQTTTAK